MCGSEEPTDVLLRYRGVRAKHAALFVGHPTLLEHDARALGAAARHGGRRRAEAVELLLRGGFEACFVCVEKKCWTPTIIFGGKLF